MGLKYFEKVNVKKLDEVLNCENIPFKSKSDNDIKWSDSSKSMLYNYKGKVKNGYVETEYKQNNNFGRFMSSGYQQFQKDVKIYISSDEKGINYYQDIDIVNCQPVFLEQLFKKNGIVSPKFLEDYVKNREKTIKKYNLGNKKGMLQIINNSVCKNKNDEIRRFHHILYNDLFKLLKKERQQEYKQISKIKNKKGEINIDGSFIAMYLQDLENHILMNIKKYIEEQTDLKIGCLMFDGLMVERNECINTELLEKIEEYICEETGYDIKIIEKPLITDWIPIQGEQNIINMFKEPDLGDEYSLDKANEMYCKIYNEDGSINEAMKDKLVNYISMYLIEIKYPLKYYYRVNTKHDFYPRNEIPMQLFGLLPCGKVWAITDKKKSYYKSRFIPDITDPEFKCNTVFNSYIMPEYIKTDRTLEEICPIFNTFLFEAMSNSIETHYNFYIEWITKMIQRGRTEILIALLGVKGVGKSSFVDCIVPLITDDPTKYYNNIQDIDNLKSFFNAASESCILTSVEEIKAGAGDYNSLQSKIKTLVTEEYMMINKKGVDTLGVSKTYNNYILCTNESNPINITYDNRRYFATTVNPKYQCQSNFFYKMKKEVKDNIKEMRGFFRSRKVIYNLNNIRPITETEIKIRKLNTQGIDQYLEEQLEYDLQNERGLKEIYNKYKYFIRSSGQSKDIQLKYFENYVENKGYIVKRLRFNDDYRKKYIFKVGEIRQTLEDLGLLNID